MILRLLLLSVLLYVADAGGNKGKKAAVAVETRPATAPSSDPLSAFTLAKKAPIRKSASLFCSTQFPGHVARDKCVQTLVNRWRGTYDVVRALPEVRGTPSLKLAHQHLSRGKRLIEQGFHDEGVTHLMRAASLCPYPNEAAQRWPRLNDTESPKLWHIYFRMGEAHLAAGDTTLAFEAFETAFDLQTKLDTWYPPLASERALGLQRHMPVNWRQPCYKYPEMSQFGLRHDLMQAHLLGADGILPLDQVQQMTAAYHEVLSQVYPHGELRNPRYKPHGKPTDFLHGSLMPEQWQRIAPWYGRQLYKHPTGLAPGEFAVNPNLDFEALQDAYFAHESIVSVDNLLTPKALDQLRSFLLYSSIWNTPKRGGYIGTFMHYGFASPLLAQIAEELRTRFPRIFCQHKLYTSWAFLYDDELSEGIGVHADNAAVNVNIWITPDEANLNPDSGGLVVYPVKTKSEMGEDVYNTLNPVTEGLLRSINYRNQTFGYKQNRMVLFDSDFLHATDKIEFKRGYSKRRINVTFLYGDMGAKCEAA